MKAYKTWGQCPEEKRIAGVPLTHPWQVQSCAQEEVASLQANGFTIVTDEEYQAVLDISEHTSFASGFKTVPRVVSPRQIRIALIASGFTLSTIESAIAALPEPDRSFAQVSWEYSVEFQRDNPLILSMAPVLGLTSQQIDNLFIMASSL